MFRFSGLLLGLIFSLAYSWCKNSSGGAAPAKMKKTRRHSAASPPASPPHLRAAKSRPRTPNYCAQERGVGARQRTATKHRLSGICVSRKPGWSRWSQEGARGAAALFANQLLLLDSRALLPNPLGPVL